MPHLDTWRRHLPKLSDSIKETIADVRRAMIATAGRDGKPNVSAKGSLRVLDDDHLVFADISSPRTVANLRENPSVSVLVVHPKTMRGCRVWGKAEIEDSGDVFDSMVKEYAERNIEVNHVIRITVEEASESF
jgi:predicted pyridoxine 5'-phosphate oxidase superfamily flavin-nucleotide-binding protein